MDIKQKVIECNGYVFPYTLHIKKVKNIILKIQPTGEIVVSANAYIPQAKIDAFLIEKLSWILKKQEQQKKLHNVQFVDCFTQDEFYYLGKAYNIVKIQSNKDSVLLDEDNLYVYYRNDIQKCNQTIRKFIRKRFEQLADMLTKEYYEQMTSYGFVYPTIKYRFMKTRWGSCATNKATITLNLFMIHYPIEFLEYVIVHELAHFVQPNHSKSFYHVIERIMPDYKARMNIPRTMK